MRLLLTALLLATGCGPKVLTSPGPTSVVGRTPTRTASQPRTEPDRPSRDTPSARPERPVEHPLVSAANKLLKQRYPRGARNDCSGFVCLTYDRAGGDLSGNTASLWQMARENGWTHRKKRPAPGDLVFFDNTYDRNGNRRLDDELTHMGIVLSVDGDGTITVAHGGTKKGHTTMVMNLLQRSDHEDGGGKVVNDYLRARSSRDPAAARYLSGELWRGFATIPLDP